MQIRRALTGVLCILIPALAGTMSSAPAAQPNGWLLHQTTSIQGNQVAYLSTTAMKTESLSYTTIVRAPKYTTSLYNNRTKCYLTKTYTEWKQRLSSAKHAATRLDVRQGKSGTIAGLRARQIFLDKTKSGHRTKHFEFWVTKEIGIPQQFVECCASLCEVPAEYGLPLRVIRTRQDGGKTIVLDTQSCKRTVIPPSTWQGPEGYKRVSDEVTVMMGDIEMGDILGK